MNVMFRSSRLLKWAAESKPINESRLLKRRYSSSSDESDITDSLDIQCKNNGNLHLSGGVSDVIVPPECREDPFEIRFELQESIEDKGYSGKNID